MDLWLVVLGSALALAGGLLSDSWRDERLSRRGASRVASELRLHRIRLVTWWGRIETAAAGSEASGRSRPPGTPEDWKDLALASVVSHFGEPLPELSSTAFDAHMLSFQHLLGEEDEARLYTYYLYVQHPGDLPLETFRNVSSHLERSVETCRSVTQRRIVNGAWRYLKRLSH